MVYVQVPYYYIVRTCKCVVNTSQHSRKLFGSTRVLNTLLACVQSLPNIEVLLLWDICPSRTLVKVN